MGGLEGRKKKTTKAQGQHQRIDIRRSIKKGGLEDSKNKNGPPLFSEGDEGGGGLTETRASEAKGPFPGGKRVGSWGKKKKKRKKKAKGEHQRIYIRRSIKNGGLKVIDKRVGSWGKKKGKRKKKVDPPSAVSGLKGI